MYSRLFGNTRNRKGYFGAADSVIDEAASQRGIAATRSTPFSGKQLLEEFIGLVRRAIAFRQVTAQAVIPMAPVSDGRTA